MILLEVANELAQTTGDQAIEAAGGEYLRRILTHFIRPARNNLVLEFLDAEYRELPAPEGSYVCPGHAIESMWFVLHRARRTGDTDAIRTAVDVIHRHLQVGWDQVHGGLFLGVDAEGGTPLLPHSEKKLWWPHTEALYALLLAHELTAEPWCLEWYQRVHEWAFHHFEMPGIGEWRQRLDRTGAPIQEVIALPVKDPFHLPREPVTAAYTLPFATVGGTNLTNPWSRSAGFISLFHSSSPRSDASNACSTVGVEGSE
jgi:N-acylglucosamine 2-epimerase